MRNAIPVIFFCAAAANLSAQSPTIIAVLNAASLTAGPIAPREVAEIFGSALGPTPAQTCPIPFPKTCGGVSVLVNGTAAPMVLVSSGQVGFEVPVDLSGPTAQVQVTTQVNGQTLQSPVVAVPVSAVAPAIFGSSGSAGFGMFLRAAATLVSESAPALPGEPLTIFGTGFGQTNPVGTSGTLPPANTKLVAPVSVTVAGLDAKISAAIPSPATPGLDQVDFTVPLAVPAGNLPVVVTVGGQAAKSVLLPITLRPVITGVSNNASGAPGIESGSWISIYGAALSATTRIWQAADFAGNNLPASLDGVSVKVNGKAASVYYISPSQLNVQAPADTALGPVQVEITNSYGVGTGTATLQAYAPGFYTFQGQYAAAIHSDGAYVAPAGYFGSSTSSRPAQPGEILAIFGTGFGPTTPAVPAGQIVSGAALLSDLTQLRITVGGAPATVQFAGIVASGEYQLNITVPTVNDGDQPIVATIGGVTSQTGLAIPVKK